MHKISLKLAHCITLAIVIAALALAFFAHAREYQTLAETGKFKRHLVDIGCTAEELEQGDVVKNEALTAYHCTDRVGVMRASYVIQISERLVSVSAVQ